MKLFSKKYLLSLFFVLCLLGLNLSAKGIVAEKQVEQKESWTESVDIAEKKPGKYNIVVTAQDQSGNIQQVGPHNIYIDNESDIPIAEISNPRENMHVPGNLNIVGTCFDDDEVLRVEIILDDDIDNIIIPEGREYWSYYLDTSNMEEGLHKITVYGVDKNEVTGRFTKFEKTVYWHLDRKQPKVEVTNFEMGAKVSGTIKLEGTVEDGNGISRLMYSLDRGEHYSNISFKSNKDGTNCTFSLPIDTKKLEDGGTICYFKTSDKQGSTGFSSFLFFVDNTKPLVNVVYPAVNEAVNGKFTAAGYAKDTMGIQKLTWEFNGQSGEFPLTAGNPYWSLDLDASTIGGKSSPLTITAIDGVGNIATVKHSISLDSASDKANVVLNAPKENEVVEDFAYIRGIATDDDGVAKINYILDSNSVVSVETDGVFSIDVSSGLENPLSAGVHTVKVWATDINGLDGNVVTAKFTVAGEKISFTNRLTNGGNGAGDVAYVAGVELNAENAPVFKATAVSPCGIKSVSYQFEGKDEVVLSSAVNKNQYSYSIPIKNCPYGFCKLVVKATDAYDRVSQDIVYFYVKDLTTIRANDRKEDKKCEVVFTDNFVDETGVIEVSKSSVVGGYFIGGEAASVRLEPASNFASVSLNGNSIVLTSGSGAGVSDQTTIVVRSKKGVEYKSKPFILKAATPLPKIAFSTPVVMEGMEDVTIRGNISCAKSSSARNDLTVKSLSYRTLTGKIKGEWTNVAMNGSDFSLTIESSAFLEGVTVVEFLATDNLGQTGSNAVFVKKIMPLGPDEKKVPSPVLYWIEGENIYYSCFFKGAYTFGGVKINGSLSESHTNELCGMIDREKLNYGANNLEFSITDGLGKSYSSSISVKRASSIYAYIESVGGIDYKSGMKVNLKPRSSSAVFGFSENPDELVSQNVTAIIECPVALSSVKYSVGNSSFTAAKAIQKLSDDKYKIEFPVSNLEYKLQDINIEATASDGKTCLARGTICVVQSYPKAFVKNDAKVYWAAPEVVSVGEGINGYANVVAPIRASIASGGAGNLTLTTEGNNIVITPQKAGIYSGIVVSVVDADGVSYTSEPLSFVSDSTRPKVTINSPKNMVWVQKRLDVSGVATDDLSVSKVEWSIDNGETWNNCANAAVGSASVNFTQGIDLSSLPDGLISLDIRATDRSGNTGYAHFSAQKRTEGPKVRLLVPCEGDVINGWNQIAFKLEDSGSIASMNFGGDPKKPFKVAPYVSQMIGVDAYPLTNAMQFVLTDKAGNVTVEKAWPFKIDYQKDLPVAEIHVPAEGNVVTDSFVVSGVVMDDDGDCKIYYKIDNGNYSQVAGATSSYNIPIDIASLTDNEHTITVYGEDIHGKKGESVVRSFRVSLEEPKGSVDAPSFDTTVKQKVRVSGTASDKNGIEKVLISLDNANTWNDTIGTTSWHYDIDTRVINDGTHTIFIKIIDKCGIQAIYSNLINIDNTKPEIQIESPRDGDRLSKELFVSGQTTDNINLTKLSINITALDSRTPVPSGLAKIPVEAEQIITKKIDISSLQDGFYNIEVQGQDAAGNVTRVSRNIEVSKRAGLSKVDLLTPFNGEHLHGEFNIAGFSESEFKYEKVTLYVDGKKIEDKAVNPTGYFRFNLFEFARAEEAERKAAAAKAAAEATEGEAVPEAVQESTEEKVVLSDGVHKIQVWGTLEDGSIIKSDEIVFNYEMAGPWIKIDNFDFGNYAVRRPKVEGTAGYTISKEDKAKLQDKATSKEEKEEILAKTLDKIEISYDNGNTFEKLGKKAKWRFRVENEYLKEGLHYVIVKATMKNGEVVAVRLMIQIDKQNPQVKLIEPVSMGHYNKELIFSGLASDESNLKDVTVTLRSGDKSQYEVASIFQGVYFDVHTLGASLYEVGAGLSFFDDNVKLQFQYGQMTDEQYALLCSFFGRENGGMRYGGNIYGLKLLANVFLLPFKQFFGPSWEWLNMSLAIGADFSVFTQTQAGKSQVLSAMIVQLEFPRIQIPDAKVFGTFSFYSEYQLWFIPSDIIDETVKAVVNQFAFGFRLYLF